MTDLNELWERVKGGRQAWATTSKPVVLRDFHKNTETVAPAGTRVRVVMASSDGDVGITDDLEDSQGYKARVVCVPTERVPNPRPILKDIEYIPIE